MQVNSNTNVVFVIDESGSMQPFRHAVVKQFNELLGTVPRGNTVRFIPFSERHRIRVVDDFNTATYNPSGNTALWDAVSLAIATADNGHTPVLIVAITDGEENASMTRTAELSNRIRSLQATDRFTFAFMVPNGYKRALVLNLGIPEGNITEWEQTREGLERVSAATASGFGSYFFGRAQGKTSVATFYSDASKLTPKDITQATVQMQGRVLTVPKEMEIQPFVEQSGHQFWPGCAAYQLTKPEKVQGYKDMFIIEKGKKTINGGAAVRTLLGIPAGDVKVVPGNHANYDIFVRSHSVNRKLVRGTKLLYFDR